MQLYVCSKIHLSPVWQAHRDEDHWPVNAGWIDVNIDNDADMAEITDKVWLPHIIPQVRAATHILAVVGENDHLKAGFIELGGMVIWGKPTAIVVPGGSESFFRQRLGTWGKLPWVFIASGRQEAFDWLKAYRPSHPLAAGFDI